MKNQEKFNKDCQTDKHPNSGGEGYGPNFL